MAKRSLTPTPALASSFASALRSASFANRELRLRADREKTCAEQDSCSPTPS